MPVDVTQLAQIPLFEALDPESFALLARAVEHHRLASGSTLFGAGDPGDSLFIVSSGDVELSIRDTAGTKISLKTCSTGEIFGELALLDEGPRTATAVAASDTELISLDREALLVLFKKKPEAALHMLAGMGAMTRRADELLRTRVVKNANDELDHKITLVERAADWIAWFSGSMYFLALNALFFAVWIGLHSLELATFDPFPFGLLTMIVSLEAIFLSIFVLISQNRQAAKDRVRADVEYEINVKAELEVQHLHDKVDRLHQESLGRMLKLERLVGGNKGEGDERRQNLGRGARRGGSQ